MRLYHLSNWLPLVGLASAGEFAAAQNGLTVTTKTGVFTGLQNPEYSGVREFRSIPYAEPPVGRRRWKPPVALRPSKEHSFSYAYSASCSQYLFKKTLSLWSTNISDFGISTDGQGHLAGTIAQSSSEDCLGLAIWTPRNVKADAKLPVALFVHGGSWIGGGVNVPYEIPAGWINRTQEHIVVAINYRVNIFGFPNAAGLQENNLGILDARLATEWVYENIAAFGGDPDRIVLWGQSAGAVLVDVLNFAYYDNPLVSAFFLESGNAMRKFPEGDQALQSNFSTVAKALGCNFPNQPEIEVSCMKQVPGNLIMNYIGSYWDNKTLPEIDFLPVVDNRTVFHNYTARAELGLISKTPALVSTTANEEASLVAYPVNNLVAGPNQTLVDLATLAVFVCPAFIGRNVRVLNKLTTYRYQYAGNFTNLTPYAWMGAYHASDVPVIFGTYEIPGPASSFEHEVAATIEDWLLEFLKDPEDGLKNVGWAPDSSITNGTMIRFAAGGVVSETIPSSEVDNACLLGAKVYNAFPQ